MKLPSLLPRSKSCTICQCFVLCRHFAIRRFVIGYWQKRRFNWIRICTTPTIRLRADCHLQSWCNHDGDLETRFLFSDVNTFSWSSLARVQTKHSELCVRDRVRDYRQYRPYDSTTATATWVIFTSGRVLRMSRFLSRRSPFTRGRQQALFDVEGKRGAILSTMAKESR